MDMKHQLGFDIPSKKSVGLVSTNSDYITYKHILAAWQLVIECFKRHDYMIKAHNKYRKRFVSSNSPRQVNLMWNN